MHLLDQPADPLGDGDLSFLDALLAETDDGDSFSLAAPLDVEVASSSPSTLELEPTSDSNEQTTTEAAMRQWQLEASRLWQERVKKTAVTISTATKPKSNSWQRRKREMQQLRDQVKQLEDELTARQAYTTGSSLPPDSSEEHRLRLQRRREYLSIAWKLAAEREAQLKSVSLVENARLKQLAERHSQLSSALQTALFQHQQRDTASVTVSLPDQARLQSSIERASLFVALEQQLDARLELVQDISSQVCAPSTRPSDMMEVNVNVDSGDSVQPVGNIQRAKSFPFRVASIMDILWKCAENGFREVSVSNHAALRLSANSLGMDSECNLQLLGLDVSPCSFHVRGVLKRWVTADQRVLTQFACVTEWPSASGSDSSSSLVTEEFAWTLTLSGDAPRPTATTAVGDSAHMRSSIESTLVAPASSRASSIRARRELIANTVLPSLTAMMKRMDQVVENALLDSARAASSR